MVLWSTLLDTLSIRVSSKSIFDGGVNLGDPSATMHRISTKDVVLESVIAIEESCKTLLSL